MYYTLNSVEIVTKIVVIIFGIVYATLCSQIIFTYILSMTSFFFELCFIHVDLNVYIV